MRVRLVVSCRCGDHGESARLLLHLSPVQRPSQRSQRLHRLLCRLHGERSNWSRRRVPLSGSGPAAGQGSVLWRSAQLAALHPRPSRSVGRMRRRGYVRFTVHVRRGVVSAIGPSVLCENSRRVLVHLFCIVHIAWMERSWVACVSRVIAHDPA